MKKPLQKWILMLVLFTLLMPGLSVKADMPEINGSSAVVFDLDSFELIYTKDMDSPMYPASITKLVTALVFSDHYNARKTEYLIYPQEAKLVPAFAIYWNLYNIPVGTEFTADEMMHALLIRSFNDASMVVAMNVAGSEEAFVELMNEKAQELGMNNSQFRNSSGLDHEEQLTTAYDLMFLLKAAYEDPWIREVMSKQSHELKTKDMTLGLMENTNKHVGLFGNILGKTGTTSLAGRNFAGIYQREGRTLGSIILRSNYPNDPENLRIFEDTQRLVDSAFLEERIIKLSKSEEVGLLQVSYRPYRFFGPTKEMEIPVKSEDSLSYYRNDVNLREAVVNLTYKEVTASDVKVDSIVGTAILKERHRETTVNLLSTVDMEKEILKTHLLSYILITLTTLTVTILILFLVIRARQKKLARRRRIEAARKKRKYVDERGKKGFLE